MKVRKGLGGRPVSDYLSKLREDKACKLANLLNLQHHIDKMAKIKIAARNKPIMSAALEAEIEAALMRYEKKTTWAQWGLEDLRKQGNMVFLKGEPGTGKTMIATYMSKRIGKGMVTLNLKDVGGKAPGHTERMTHQTFEDARVGGNKTIFMDECEAIVWDRRRAGSDSMWMVGVIDEILMQTTKYPGLIVACSNSPEIVDDALISRCFAVLHVGYPDEPERKRIWQQKMPDRFPLKLTPVMLEKIASLHITGRDIENSICKEASNALVAGRLPEFGGLFNIAKTFVK